MPPKQRLEVNESFLGARIEHIWEFTEEDNIKVLQWCQGKVLAVKKKKRVHIEWEGKYLQKGDRKIFKEMLMISKWNKHVEKAWIMNLAYNVCLVQVCMSEKVYSIVSDFRISIRSSRETMRGTLMMLGGVFTSSYVGLYV